MICNVLAGALLLVAAVYGDYVGNIQFNVTTRNGDKLFYSHNVDRFSPSIATYSARSQSNDIYRFEVRVDALRETVRSATVTNYRLDTLLEDYDVNDLFFFPGRDTQNVIKTLNRYTPTLASICLGWKKDGDYLQSNPRTDKKIALKLRTMLPPKIPITVHRILQSAMRPFFRSLQRAIPSDVQTYVEDDGDDAVLVITYFDINLDGDEDNGRTSSLKISLSQQGLRINVQSSRQSLEDLIDDASVRQAY